MSDKQIVIAAMTGMKDYFATHKEHAEKASTMWAAAGESSGVLSIMIAEHCKFEAAAGRVSGLEKFNVDGGGVTLRDMIDALKDDADVAPLIALFKQ